MNTKLIAAKFSCNHRLHKAAQPAEHIGFVAYAASEAFHLGAFAAYVVAVWLTLTGLWVFFADDVAAFLSLRGEG